MNINVMKKRYTVEVPGGADKVLLHTCCAPCSSAIIECLMSHGITPVIYYCNPNIYPEEEYRIRKDECTRYATALGLEIIDADYDHEAWRCEMRGLEGEPERGSRCLRCFKMRLLDTARWETRGRPCLWGHSVPARFFAAARHAGVEAEPPATGRN